MIVPVPQECPLPTSTRSLTDEVMNVSGAATATDKKSGKRTECIPSTKKSFHALKKFILAFL
jgi:hypothetical protein